MLVSLASQPVAAFPAIRSGRLPHCTFRGLLGVHSQLRPARSPGRPRQPVPSECFRPCRCLHRPLRLLPAGATVAGRDSHPLGDGAFPRHTVSHVRVRAFRAAVRNARLIAHARAQRRAHVSRPFFPWVFFAPARGGRRSGFRMPLRPVSSYHGFYTVKPLPGIISYFMNELLPRGGDPGTCHVLSCSAAAPPADALSQFEPTTLSPMSIPCLREFPDMSLLSRTAV